jgi:hypothetical protein
MQTIFVRFKMANTAVIASKKLKKKKENFEAVVPL